MELLGAEEAIPLEKERVLGSLPVLVGSRVQEEQEARMESLPEEEIMEAVRRIKLKKATEVDGIPMETWRLRGIVVKKGLIEIIQKVWNEIKIPEEWKSIIVPLYKRGDPNVMQNYRGILLLCTAYKIYAEIIRRRLMVEVEKQRALPESQMSFRKGWSTGQHLYTESYSAERKDENKGGKEGVCAIHRLQSGF